MHPWATVVIVLLHLHASVTLREEFGQTKYKAISSTKMTNSHQSVNHLTPSRNQQHSQRSISNEDEDLLDLMVRIAETPAEWERIHRVLSLIGANEKESSRHSEDVSAIESTDTTEQKIIQNRITYNSSGINNLTTETPLRTLNDSATTFSISDTTTSVFNHGQQYMDYQSDQGPITARVEDSDTGWPDFDEAITKQIKKSHRTIDDNDILSSNWFEDEWMDTSWNEFVRTQDELNSLVAKSPEKKDFAKVSFKPVNSIEPSDELKGTNTIMSRLSSDPKILEFPLKGDTSIQNQTVQLDISKEEGLNKSSRPIFLYHRVTTSPQERKRNSAFIAVSVVKQSPLEPPVSTRTPVEELASRWSLSRHVHGIQGDTAQGTAHRKHPTRGNHHHHTRNGGRRHYRSQGQISP